MIGPQGLRCGSVRASCLAQSTDQPEVWEGGSRACEGSGPAGLPSECACPARIRARWTTVVSRRCRRSDDAGCPHLRGSVALPEPVEKGGMQEKGQVATARPPYEHPAAWRPFAGRPLRPQSPSASRIGRSGEDPLLRTQRLGAGRSPLSRVPCSLSGGGDRGKLAKGTLRQRASSQARRVGDLVVGWCGLERTRRSPEYEDDAGKGAARAVAVVSGLLPPDCIEAVTPEELAQAAAA